MDVKLVHMITALREEARVRNAARMLTETVQSTNAIVRHDISSDAALQLVTVIRNVGHENVLEDSEIAPILQPVVAD